MDPTITAAAIVTVIAASIGGIVQIINAWSAAKERAVAAAERQILLRQADQAAEKVALVAVNAAVIAERAKVADGKLDKIQATTSESGHNINGNLTAVRDELTKQTAHSQALQETVNTLAEVIKSQRTTITSIDHAVNGATTKTDTAEKSLEKIEGHTEAIQNNTARTEATVKKLDDKS